MVAVHATRDDGHVLNFRANGGSFSAEPGIGSRLVAISGGYQLLDESDNTETYDASGKLLSVADRVGNLQTLTYAGPGGALSSIVDNTGHSITLGYDSSNRLHTVSGPDALPVTYDYDSAGHLWKITNNDGISYHQFLYQDPNSPTGISSLIDDNNQTHFTLSYDTSGRVLTSQLAGISTAMRFNYNVDGSTTQTDTLGAVRTFVSTPIGGHKLSSSTSGPPCDDCGYSTGTTYDSGGFPQSRTDYNGNITTYIYDDVRGLERSRTEARMTAQQRTITTTWEPGFRLPHEIDEPGRTTVLSHDLMNGNLLSKTVTDTTTGRSRTWTYANYNAYGQPQTIDGPRTDVTDVTQLTYYVCNTGAQCGQLKTITDPLGHLTTFNSYDSNGRLKTITDSNLVVSQISYKPRGWVSSVTVASQKTSFSYDNVGQLKKLTLPNGAYLSYTYNAAHQLTQVKDQLGDKITYTPDAMGNSTQEKVYDPSGVLVQTRKHVFDTLNRLRQDIGADTVHEITAYTYDNNGNLKTITDPLTHQTVNGYDALDRLIQITDPNLKNSAYVPNALDQLTQVTDPLNHNTIYTVDGLGNVGQISSTDSGITGQLFDDAGNLIQKTDAKNQITRYQYDALNRPTLETRHNGSTVSYTYDQGGYGIGHLTGMSDPSGSTSWSYDANGHAIQKSVTVGGQTLVTQYGYDSVTGNLISMTLPSNKVVGYTWTNGQVTALTLNGAALVSSIVWQPFSGPKSWIFANGETVSRSYDLNGRVSADPVETIGYDYASRIISWTLGGQSQISGTHTFGYDDPLDHVASYTGGATSPLGFSYDANGNRLTQTVNSTALTYTVDTNSNRYTRNDGGSPSGNFGYDANGSRNAYGSRVYTYDTIGRLVGFSYGTKVATYVYDGLGERVQKTLNGTATLFVYDELRHLIGEYNSSGAPNQETIFLGNMPVAVLKGSSTYYVHADYRDTPRQIDNASRQAVWVWDPTPFGDNQPNNNPLGLSSTFTYNPRYPGQYYDSESGYFYNGFRDYDPLLGRYLEPDPIGLTGGLNPYAYVDGNPVNYIDSLGLAKCTLIFNGGAGSLHCDPDDPESNDPVTIQVASGNNGGGSHCKNNLDCQNEIGRGPIPAGCWQWNGGYTSKPNGRALAPCAGWTSNRTNIRSHSCENAFGMSKTSPFCSEGCVTGTASDIQTLNRLLDAEPRSMLWVGPLIPAAPPPLDSGLAGFLPRRQIRQ